jgi:hypothetical protein
VSPALVLVLVAVVRSSLYLFDSVYILCLLRVSLVVISFEVAFVYCLLCVVLLFQFVVVVEGDGVTK